MATIDVNIPDSALETLAEQLVPLVKDELDIDKIEDLETLVQDIESRLEDAERRIEDVPSDCASNDDVERLEERVESLEDGERSLGDFKELGSRVEALEELIVRVATVEKRLEDIVATLRQASDRINLGLTY